MNIIKSKENERKKNTQIRKEKDLETNKKRKRFGNKGVVEIWNRCKQY